MKWQENNHRSPKTFMYSHSPPVPPLIFTHTPSYPIKYTHVHTLLLSHTLQVLTHPSVPHVTCTYTPLLSHALHVLTIPSCAPPCMYLHFPPVPQLTCTPTLRILSPLANHLHLLTAWSSTYINTNSPTVFNLNSHTLLRWKLPEAQETGRSPSSPYTHILPYNPCPMSALNRPTGRLSRHRSEQAYWPSISPSL
jgi:hypothetical protein